TGAHQPSARMVEGHGACRRDAGRAASRSRSAGAAGAQRSARSARPGERRLQNDAGFPIAEAALVYAVERKPEYLTASKAWTLAAIDYEPWGYTYNKPNTDLAARHLLYAIGWAYDLLYDDFSVAERTRVQRSLERHAALVYDALAPKPGR